MGANDRSNLNSDALDDEERYFVRQVNYIEEKTIVKIGNSKGVFLKPKLLDMLELKLGDKVKINYNLITMEIVISGVG